MKREEIVLQNISKRNIKNRKMEKLQIFTSANPTKWEEKPISNVEDVALMEEDFNDVQKSKTIVKLICKILV